MSFNLEDSHTSDFFKKNIIDCNSTEQAFVVKAKTPGESYNAKKISTIVDRLQKNLEDAYAKGSTRTLQHILTNIEQFNTLVVAEYNQTVIDPRERVAGVHTELIFNAHQFGNKAANLMELQKVLGKEADVPDFCALSHKEIAKVVSTEKFNLLWEKFKTQQGSQKQYLNSEAKAILVEIRKEITEALRNYRSPNMETWLSSHKDQLLMVRSTGKEDSKTNANAGGNESVAAVKPEKSSVSEAIKTVVLSYFSDKSLEQRLLADDDITKDPFMPVLLQVMESEKLGGATDPQEIYVSGVGFFREAEGKTENVLHLQATFGHGEAVVNSRTPTDSYHVGKSGKIDKVIREKPQRLVPKEVDGEYKLEFERNLEPRQSSLTDEQILQLKKIATTLRSHYGYDIDFEYTINRVTGRIKLLQVRPITHAKSQDPSFIKNADSIASERTIHGSPIGIGGGAVRASITQKEQLLVADTLPDALNLYLRQRQKNSVQAVVVKTWAPATSHEATIFRSRGIPVILVQDLDTIKAWSSKNNFSLLISPQQGLVINQEGLTEKPIIDVGWISHPIPKQKTIESISYGTNVVKAIADELPPSDQLFPLSDAGTSYSLPLLLDMIGGENKQEALKALATILQRLTSLSTSPKAEKHPELQATMNRLFQNSVLAAGEIIEAYKKPNDRLGILYARNSLESILNQFPMDGIVDADSYRDTLATLKWEHALTDRLIDKGLTPSVQAYATQFLKLGKAGLTETTAKNWERFILEIAEREDGEVQCKRLASLLKKLDAYGLKETWLNTRFNDVWKEVCSIRGKPTPKGRTDAILLNLVREINKDKDAFKWIAHQKEMLQRWEMQAQTWGDIAAYTKLNEEFQKEFNKTFSHFTEKTMAAGPIGKAALLNFLTTTLDVMDHSIKGLTGSTQYDDSQVELKARRFASMLHNYNRLLLQIASLLDDDMKKSLVNGHLQNFYTHLDQISEKLQEFDRTMLKLSSSAQAAERREFCAKQFIPGAAFSVSDVQLGVGTGHAKESVNHLEEIFTLIHQDGLQMLSQLKRDIGIQPKQMPPVLQQLHKSLDSIPLPTGKASTHLISADYAYPYIKMRHNLPLRCHSITIDTLYDQRSGKTEIKVNLIGENVVLWSSEEGEYPDAYDRMNSVGICSLLGASALGIGFAPGAAPIYVNGALKFTWEIDSRSLDDKEKAANTCDKLQQYLKLMIAITMPKDLESNAAFASPTGEPYVFRELAISPHDRVLSRADFRTQEVIDNLAKIEPAVTAVVTSIDDEFVKKHPVLIPYYESQLRKNGQEDKALKLCLETYLNADQNPLITQAVKIHVFDQLKTPIKNLESALNYLEERGLHKEKLRLCQEVFLQYITKKNDPFSSLSKESAELSIQNILQAYANSDTHALAKPVLSQLLLQYTAHLKYSWEIDSLLKQVKKIEDSTKISSPLSSLLKLQLISLPLIEVIEDRVQKGRFDEAMESYEMVLDAYLAQGHILKEKVRETDFQNALEKLLNYYAKPETRQLAKTILQKQLSTHTQAISKIKDYPEILQRLETIEKEQGITPSLALELATKLAFSGDEHLSSILKRQLDAKQLIQLTNLCKDVLLMGAADDPEVPRITPKMKQLAVGYLLHCYTNTDPELQKAGKQAWENLLLNQTQIFGQLSDFADILQTLQAKEKENNIPSLLSDEFMQKFALCSKEFMLKFDAEVPGPLKFVLDHYYKEGQYSQLTEVCKSILLKSSSREAQNITIAMKQAAVGYLLHSYTNPMIREIGKKAWEDLLLNSTDIFSQVSDYPDILNVLRENETRAGITPSLISEKFMQKLALCGPGSLNYVIDTYNATERYDQLTEVCKEVILMPIENPPKAAQTIAQMKQRAFAVLLELYLSPKPELQRIGRHAWESLLLTHHSRFLETNKDASILLALEAGEQQHKISSPISAEFRTRHPLDTPPSSISKTSSGTSLYFA